ncbi:hypothetical protein ACW5R3_04100 [Bizionia sp. KMM 8389]
MATQGERQDFNWRPNDNSSTTLTRYHQEAEHWVRAFKNAESKHKPVNYKEDIQTIGLIISLVLSLITLSCLILVKVFQWLKSL